MFRYDYDELRAKALSPKATQEDLRNLAEWFDQYDSADWNGEYYDCDGYGLYPIYKEVAEDEWEITGYEVR